MTRTESHGVGRAGKVNVVGCGLGSSKLFLQLVDTLQSRLLQLVDFHAYHLLLFGWNRAEIGHESVYLSLLAEVFQSQLFYLL